MNEVSSMQADDDVDGDFNNEDYASFISFLDGCVLSSFNRL